LVNLVVFKDNKGECEIKNMFQVEVRGQKYEVRSRKILAVEYSFSYSLYKLY